MDSCQASLNKWQCVLPEGHVCLHASVGETMIGTVEVLWSDDYKAIPAELRDAPWPQDTDRRALANMVGFS